jgi:hypothetical protein
MMQDVQVKLSEAVFEKKRTVLQPPGLQFKDETVKMLHLEQIFVWGWNLETAESRSEIP